MKKIQKNKAKSGGNKMKIQPLGDRVLVKTKEVGEEKTPSGIFIPDTASKEKPEEGIVMAVGEGKYIDGKLIPLKVKVGDKVVFSKYGYDEIKVDDKEYIILKEDSILAIIN